MRIYDIFLYNGERDMLEFRIKELSPYVYKFIIAESNFTFSGQYKNLSFPNDMFKYKEYNIDYVVIDKKDNKFNTAWDYEHYTRIYLGNYIKDIVNDDDILMLSDVDEIPDFRDEYLMFKIKNMNNTSSFSLAMLFFYYNFNWINQNLWPGIVFFKKSLLLNKNLEYIRSSRSFQEMIKNGYHLSYFFSPEGIVEKINAFSHQEYNHDKYKIIDEIQYKIDNGLDLFSRQNEKWILYTGNYFPKNYDLMPEFMKKTK